jgi:hypothetical protein
MRIKCRIGNKAHGDMVAVQRQPDGTHGLHHQEKHGNPVLNASGLMANPKYVEE